MLDTAKLYHGQGLLTEAILEYAKIGKILKKNLHDQEKGGAREEQGKKQKQVLGFILKQIQVLKSEIDKLENSPDTMEMPETVQEIIRTKFAFAKEEQFKELEGAIALAKFGQYTRALKEFALLIENHENQKVRLDAAKNIIRCHIALDSLQEAVKQYEMWHAKKMFAARQMDRLRMILQDTLDKRDMEINLPQAQAGDKDPEEEEIVLVEEIPQEDEEEEEGLSLGEEMLDISSVGITMPSGDNAGKIREIDVSFQSGNVINLLISKSDRDILDNLKPRTRLKELQFYSPMAMFSGSGVVHQVVEIEAGPKQGDFSLDIQIKSIK